MTDTEMVAAMPAETLRKLVADAIGATSIDAIVTQHAVDALADEITDSLLAVNATSEPERYEIVHNTVEAFQVTHETRKDAMAWCDGDDWEHTGGVGVAAITGSYVVAEPGDWIVKTHSGNFFAVEGDEFARLYRKA